MRRRVVLALALVPTAGVVLLVWSSRDPSDPPPPASVGADGYGDPLPSWALARFGTAHRPTGGRGLAFSADGTRLRCCGIDGVLREFDLGSWTLQSEERICGDFVAVQRRSGTFTWLSDVFDPPPDPVVADLPIETRFAGSALAIAGAAQATLRGVPGLSTPHVAIRVGTAPSAVALSADGSVAAIGWQDGELAVGAPPVHVAKLATTVQGIALSPDASVAAVQAQGIHLVDTKSGVERFAEVSKDFAPRGAAFAPDGRTFVHASGTDRIALRDARDGALVWQVEMKGLLHWGDLAFSSDGRRIACAMGDVVVLDAADGHVVQRIATNARWSGAVAFSPDGSRLAASTAGSVRVWDTANWTETTPAGAIADGLEFSPDGTALLSVGRDGLARIWDAATGTLRRTLSSGGKVTQAAWSADGASVRCQEFDGTGASAIAVFDAASGARTDSFPTPKDSRPILHGVSPAFLRYTRSGATGRFGSWDVLDAKSLTVRCSTSVQSLGNANGISRDGRIAASTPGTSPVEFLDLTTGKTARSDARWSSRQGMAMLVALTPDAATVCVLLQHGHVVVAGEVEGAFDTGTHGAFAALAISPDGRLVAVGDAFGGVQLWSAARSRRLTDLAGHRDCIRTLDFSPDGSRLASGAEDATILVWDVSGFR
jgi:WD40 repeat protein